MNAVRHVSDVEADPGWTPEKRMIVAILARAVDDYVEFKRELTQPPKISLRNKKRGYHASNWLTINQYFFAGDASREWSFEWCCEHIAEDGRAIVEGLRKYLISHQLGKNDTLSAFLGRYRVYYQKV